MAPDLGEGFSKDGLREMTVPTLIIVGDQDSVTPKEKNAEFYAKNIKKAHLVVVKDVSHFTFMNQCSPLGFQITPFLCADSNKKKEALQTLTIQKVSDFLSKAFNPQTLPKKSAP
jgi:predicted dienelactone hydrolase